LEGLVLVLIGNRERKSGTVSVTQERGPQEGRRARAKRETLGTQKKKKNQGRIVLRRPCQKGELVRRIEKKRARGGRREKAEHSLQWGGERRSFLAYDGVWPNRSILHPIKRKKKGS